MPEKTHKTLPLSRLINSVKTCVGDKTKYCFIIGAGASVTSGIDSGVTMATKWLNDMKEFDSEFAEKLIAREKIEENDIGRHYPKIYKGRFRARKDEGYIWLQNAMKNASPGLGYYHLANVLADDSDCINFVITTNFDSLTEDAIFPVPHITYTPKIMPPPTTNPRLSASRRASISYNTQASSG